MGCLVSTCLLLVLLSSAVSDPPPPPGSLVIKPGGSGAVPVTPENQYPDKPGFIVIRPQRAGSPSTPKLVGEPTAAKPTTPMPRAKGDDEKKDGKIVLEQWDATYLKGHKVGYYHVIVREYERDGKKFLYATKTQKLTVGRFGQIVEQWGEDSTMETADGTILTTRMRQGLGRDQKIQLSGQVSGKVLSVKIEGEVGGTQDVPWPEGVVGISREATLMKDRKPKPGESFDYLVYEGRLNRTVKVTAQAKDFENVILVEGQKPQKMLRLIVGMEPIKIDNNGGEFRLPPTTMWCDPTTFEVLKMETDMPMFGGKLVTLRTTRDIATRAVGKVPDLFDVQSIPLNVVVPTMHDLAGAVYKVTLTGDVDPAKAFATDARQEVKALDAATKTFELHVAAVRQPGAALQKEAKQEFLAASFFIDWDNDPVKAHARQAMANLPPTATAWQKARAVESYVNRNMKAAEFSQAMATCSNVARTLSGDCTEYAMLAAGMCRALGVPSRTAIGLVYAPDRGKAFLAYHMWFEVFADGHWVALDATLGRGSIGPGHIKITDASWHEEKSFVPLLPVLTVLGASPKVEVLKTTAR